MALLEQPFASLRCSGRTIQALCELFVEYLMRVGKMRTQHSESGEE